MAARDKLIYGNGNPVVTIRCTRSLVWLGAVACATVAIPPFHYLSVCGFGGIQQTTILPSGRILNHEISIGYDLDHF
jgi:hypothetical protein